jgi:hypothetical protein
LASESRFSLSLAGLDNQFEANWAGGPDAFIPKLVVRIGAVDEYSLSSREFDIWSGFITLVRNGDAQSKRKLSLPGQAPPQSSRKLKVRKTLQKEFVDVLSSFGA